MSNIYIQEPPTSGKVLLHTTVGDIDIELWTKEAPKACRNFIQLCMEGYYNGTIFHRVIKGFIVQGGDPEGTGFGGESIYGGHFKNELHSRLRFVRRGLVALANSGKEDNGSQFFFTLGACPELQNKHTIFGKITGNTLYNMLKLEESLVDADDRPLYPHKILSSKILDNPFQDIVPRIVEKEKKPVVEEKVQEKVKKNYSLLSFGEEAEEDEAEVDAVAQEFRGKSKSSHDLAKDPDLSSVPAITDDTASSNSSVLERVRQKLKVEREEVKREPELPAQKDRNESEVDSKRKAIREEIKQIKKELRKGDQKKELEKTVNEESSTKRKHEDDPLFVKYSKQISDFKKKKNLIAPKGEEREKQTLAILAKFQDKLSAAAGKNDESTTKEPKSSNDTEEMDDGDEWLSHEFHCEEDLVVAKDVNLPSADRYDITDPRNPMNERRRHAEKKKEAKGIRA